MTKEHQPEITMKQALKEVLENSREEIQNQALEQMKDSIINNIKYGLGDELTKITKQFIEEIKPDLQELLVESKTEVLQSIKDGVIESLSKIGEKMTANAIKNLECSYTANKIIESIVKS